MKSTIDVVPFPRQQFTFIMLDRLYGKRPLEELWKFCSSVLFGLPIAVQDRIVDTSLLSYKNYIQISAFDKLNSVISNNWLFPLNIPNSAKVVKEVTTELAERCNATATLTSACHDEASINQSKSLANISKKIRRIMVLATTILALPT